MKAQPIIINNWQQGVAESAYQGFGLMRNVDIELYPGAVKAQRITTSLFHVALSTTFTADPSTDIITVAGGTVPNTGTAVTVSSSGTLPTGLTAGTRYYVIKLSASTFKLATTIANANASTAIDITGAGTGTHTVVTVNPGTMRHIVKDTRTGVLFFQDSNMRVWYLGNGATQCFLLDGNTLSQGVGNGMSLFLNSNGTATYLFVFRNSVIDIINVFGTSNLETPVWTNGWQSLNTGAGSPNSHHSILAQDNIVYFCDSRYIGSILEKPGSIFDPSNVATFTYNYQALETPQNEVLNWLEELGVSLLAAGNTYNLIYPWDRVSDSFNLPIAVPEYGVKRLKNSGNLVYILAGTKGNVYTTQGTYVTRFRKIPGYVVESSANPVTWGGIGLKNGNLLFGVQGQLSGNNGAYMAYSDGRVLMDNQPSTGSANATALYAEGDLYYLGYAGGADVISGLGNRYSNFESVIHSQIYVVGDKTGKAKLSTLEMEIGRPATGSVRISWRPDTSSSFVVLATFTGDGVATSFDSDVGLDNLENIQIQIEVTNDIEIMEIRLFP